MAEFMIYILYSNNCPDILKLIESTVYQPVLSVVCCCKLYNTMIFCEYMSKLDWKLKWHPLLPANLKSVIRIPTI